MLDQINSVLNRVFMLPGIAHWRKHRFDKAFSHGTYGGHCRGVFQSHEQAARAAPPTLPLGYDNPSAASMYRDRLDRIFPSDYPAMLWLQKAFADNVRHVFDLGGHVGVGYYAYQKHMTYPEGLTWRVCDVPAVVTAGQALASERDGRGALKFTAQFGDAESADLLFSSGCLQYLPETLAERLATLSKRPRWILINLIPLHEDHAFWTVQSIGQAFCPYRIQNTKSFFASLEALGYGVLDVWENLEKRCDVAFEPGHSLDRYYGAALYLRPTLQPRAGAAIIEAE